MTDSKITSLTPHVPLSPEEEETLKALAIRYFSGKMAPRVELQIQELPPLTLHVCRHPVHMAEDIIRKEKRFRYCPFARERLWEIEAALDQTDITKATQIAEVMIAEMREIEPWDPSPAPVRERPVVNVPYTLHSSPESYSAATGIPIESLTGTED